MFFAFRISSMKELVTETPYLACVINRINDTDGMPGVLGIIHDPEWIDAKYGSSDVDLLASLNSAYGIYSQGLRSVDYTSFNIQRYKGSKLEAFLYSRREEGFKERNLKKLEELIEVLENERETKFLKRVKHQQGDVRGLREYNFEIIKKFPFHFFDLELWDKYTPKLLLDKEDKELMKIIEKKIPYCKGYTHEIFEKTLGSLRRNLNIEQVVNNFEKMRLDEEKIRRDGDKDVLGVIDSLYNQGLLTFEEFNQGLKPGCEVRINQPLTESQRDMWGDLFQEGDVIQVNGQESGVKGVLRLLIKSGKASIVESKT